MGLHLSEPVYWEERTGLPQQAGIYVIAKGDPSNTVYIGRTWGTKGIRGRIRQFNRSALTGQKGHAGGVTFHGLFDGDTTGLFVSVHLPNGIDLKPEILHPYIAYAERRLIWEHVEAHRGLPVCNSE
ncbi:hypothetical protein [uncultured Roseobacter sp.]|uniref:hypothetical protein n=1 Tax=uncultured Roseobacter sp. TaxID=114847 RepID=UPI00263A1F71|nr:hypothetical protein [uncultured Roseobacter sp.]